MTRNRNARAVRTWLALSLGALAGAAGTGAPAAAQRTSALSGRVAADSTPNPLAGAEIIILGLGLTTRSDSGGFFAFTNLPAGTHLVVVRHIGFAPITAPLTFNGADTLARMFILEPRAAVLPTIEVAAQRPVRAADLTASKLGDFTRRSAKGIGRFYTRNDFRGMDDRRLSDFLRQVPGVKLERSAATDGVAVAGGRGGGTRRGQTSGDGFPQACYVQLLVDGTRVFAPGTGAQPVSIDDFKLGDIEAIEYFSAPTQTPPEMAGLGSQCGTLSLWLRIA